MEAVQPQFMDHWLGLILDVVLLIGISCLWLTWYRNGKRQQKMEQLLIGTAQQLEEASKHLSSATRAIEQLKKQTEAAPPAAAVQVAKKTVQKKIPTAIFELEAPKLPPQSSTQATMILRMHREGESEESIAERLDIPLAQVRLMLKLHAASDSSLSL